jgi:heat shock protein HslJ
MGESVIGARRLVVLLAAGLVSACGGGSGSADETPAAEAPAAGSVGADALVGRWRLVIIDMADEEDVEPEADAVSVIDFTDEVEPTGSRRFAGTAGCNRMMGSYDAGSTGRLAVTSGPATTLMACPDPVMRLEQAFRTALQAATGYEIDGDILSIGFGDGVILMERTDAAAN